MLENNDPLTIADFCYLTISNLQNLIRLKWDALAVSEQELQQVILIYTKLMWVV